MMNWKRFCPLCVFALLLGLAVPARAYDVSTASKQTPHRDEILADELKQEFGKHIEFRNVDVSIDDHVAVLRGSVESYREKLDAEHLARKHKGIEGIRDEIAVAPMVSISDEELRDQIANRLRYERIGYGIMFNNFQLGVKDGVVTIAGDARSYPDKASALAIIENTPGVRDVKDEINVLPLSDLDDDLRVETARAIYGDPALSKYALDPQAPIRIVVDQGKVKLYGVVNTAGDKQTAEMKASTVPGVFSVENHLLVAGDTDQKVAQTKTNPSAQRSLGAPSEP